MPDYVRELRSRVGHAPVIMIFAGGILTDRNNNILLQQRSDSNEWGLPGGAVELQESTSQTCQREFKEETGLTVQPLSIIGVHSKNIQHYPNGDTAQTIVVFYYVKVITGELDSANAETNGLGFFPANNLPTIFNEQHLEIINYFANDYQEKHQPFFD